MDMCTPDRSLEHGPERLQRVDVGIANRPLLTAVIDGGVFVPERLENAIRSPFIGTNARSLGDLADDFGDQRPTGRVGNDFGINLAFALQHTENNSLTARAASTLTRALTADIGFVNFYMASEGRFAVNLAHVIADQVHLVSGAIDGLRDEGILCGMDSWISALEDCNMEETSDG